MSQRSKLNPGSHKSAPRELVEHDVQTVNASFYSAKPREYLQHRVTALLVLASRPQEVMQMASEGLSVGELKVKSEDPKGDDDSGSLLDDESRLMFIITEAEVIMHHVGETLLRLYMAHEELPACPGWELAKVRTPRDYKTRLRKRFIDSASDTHSADVSSVFFGHADVEDIQYGKAPPEGTKPDPLNIEKFLRHFASHHLDNANAYNAAKHGLAVTAGNASMKLGDGSVLRQDGDAITFLECVYKTGKQRQWQKTTTWVRSDVSLAFALIGCRLIEQLWAVARARYLGSPLEKIKLFDTPQYDALMDEVNKPGIHAMGMSLGLFLPTDA